MSDIRLIRTSESGEVTFDLPGQIALETSGLVHLAQTVVNNLVTTPGSDDLSPYRGAGLADLTRRYRTNSEELRERIASRVEETSAQMKNEQQQLDLPPEETLDSLTVNRIEQDDKRPTYLKIYIRIRSAEGQEGQLQI